MRHESVTGDGHVVLEEECGCAASNGFFKTCERHDDLKTSKRDAGISSFTERSLEVCGGSAREASSEGSRDRYNKRARLRERIESTFKTT